ncbi:S-norcoclaurine synthase 2-like [Cucumis melo var. makuwa]|uniref:S-norcoclaurine synthase 2-like n=1 Tax=Cucumis melo var. makuwa TaxID=1194695 RepID=A0A5A7TFG6_CUCMM|nr:S-norcoclaurine synthase 2-like [Cucumis melo var. makuwa]TYJ97970.1 S-norcoclaurine synthase 2-like [Cucumis melo var. makuwa]
MLGQLRHETVIDVPANVAWQLFGSLELGRIVGEQLPNIFKKVELVEGDGGEGTILLIFASGFGTSSFKEKFTKVDNENRIKETEIIEGGLLDMGFTLYRVRFKIIENREDKCIVETTIEYEIMEESAANASLVTLQPLIEVVQLANNYLLHNKNPK